jgi:hypothetical protein
MSVTTGIRGGVNAQSSASGLQTLKSLDRDAADALLSTLRDDLQEKTGVVRLLHTSRTDKDMRFQNAGAFKRMFLSGGKLKRSGEVIHQLLQSAGLPEAKANEFLRYVNQRGHSGVEAQTVLRYLDALRAETGETPAEALSKFGVTLNEAGRAQGRVLGSGGSGEAVLVRYRGEDFVYKQALQAGARLARLPLQHPEASPADKKTEGALAQDNPSMEHFIPSQTVMKTHNQQPADLLFPLSNNGRDSSNSSQSDFSPEVKGGGQAIKRFLYQQIGAEYDEKSSRQDSLVSEFESPIGKTKGHHAPDPHSDRPGGAALARQWIGRGPIIEEHGAHAGHPLSGNEGEPNLAASVPETGAKPASKPMAAPASTPLARKGLGAAARMKDLPQVITPSVYVIKEQSTAGETRFHAVAGQARLKNWARAQGPESTFEVLGLLMPKARGKQPVEYPDPNTDQDDPPPRLNVSRDDLRPMAESAMTLLKGLAAHGFVHGDIKPENLIWNPATKVLQLIDIDGLQKVSKAEGTLVAEGLSDHSTLYANPVAFAPAYGGGKTARLGLGRDVFSMGVVLLETALLARGQSEKARTLIENITFASDPYLQSQWKKSRGEHEKGLKALGKEPFEAGSLEHFARECILRSVDYEKARLARKDFTFERYVPDQPDHLLAQLERAFHSG